MARFPFASVVVGLAVCGMFLSACGGPSASEKLQSRQLEGSRLAVVVRKREASAALRLRRAEITSCGKKIGPFMRELGDMDSRLDVGLNFSDYSTKVGDVRAAYGQIPPQSLFGACLTAALAGQDALNDYISAYSTWNDCVGDINCDNDSITPDLQDSWAKATNKVASAKGAYARVGRGAVPNRDWTNTVPISASQIAHTVYGRALVRICAGDAPAELVTPCSDLRTVVAGGVQDGELGEFDKAVRALNQALGIDPST